MKTKMLRNKCSEIVAFLFLSLIILFTIYLFSQVPYSTDNSRYLLSALAQSQAALIAIVISLTLITIQLSSQAYTLRVTDLFLKSKYFWFVFLAYIASIIYDVVILDILPLNDRSIALIFGYKLSSWYLTASAVIFVLTAFFLLFFYIKYSIQILKPENIIRMLIENLEPNKIEEYCKGDVESDPLTPIRDVCNMAVEINDNATIIACANQLERLFEETNKYMVNNYPELKSDVDIYDPFGDIEESEKVREKVNLYSHIAYQFKEFLSSLCIQACDKKLYQAVSEITRVLGKIGEIIALEGGHIGDITINFVYTIKAIDERIEKEVLELRKIFKVAPPPEVLRMLSCTISSLEGICKSTLLHDLEFTRDTIIDLLTEIGVSSSKDGPEFKDYFEPNKGPQRLGSAIGAIWGIKDTIVESLQNLNERKRMLELDTKEYNLLVSFDKCTRGLEELGEIAVKNEWKDLAIYSGWAILCGLKELIDKKYVGIVKPINPVETVVNSIKNILTSSDNTTSYHLTKQMLGQLEDITKNVARNGISDTRYLIRAIASIYDFVCEKHCRGHPADMILGAPSFLGEVAEILVTKGNFDVAECAVSILKDIGVKAAKKGKGWEYVSEGAMKWLVLLGVLSLKNGNKEFAIKVAKKIKEIVENTESVSLKGVLQNIEEHKTFGVGYWGNKDGLVVHQERKVKNNEYEFYKQFRNLIH